MQEKYSKDVQLNLAADESKKIIFPDWHGGLGSVYFLKLVLKDKDGKEISSNFYWLSFKGDENTDFTALNKLPEVELNFSVSSFDLKNGKYKAAVDIENPSASLAFLVNPKIIRRDSKDLVLPFFWEDNYFALLPKEKRSLKVEFDASDLNGETPLLAIDGWDIKKSEKELK